MMMILLSSSDTAPFNRIEKTCTPDYWNMPVYSGGLKQPDAIRAAHEGVIGQILTMNLLRIQAFWSHHRFRQQNARLNALLHQQLPYDQCHLQPAALLQLALTARCHARNSNSC